MSRPFEDLAPAERQALAAAAIQNARQALQQGDQPNARRFAQQAVSLSPDREDGWLLMAALAKPQASLAYLEQALRVNPASQRARKGMHWALVRLRAEGAFGGAAERPLATQVVSPPTQALTSAPTSLSAAAREKGFPDSPNSSANLPSTVAAPTIAVPTLAVPPVASPIAQPRSTVRVRPVARRKPRRSLPFLLVYALATFCLSGALFAGSLAPYYPDISSSFSPLWLAQAPLMQVAGTYLPEALHSTLVAYSFAAQSPSPEPDSQASQTPPSEPTSSPTETHPVPSETPTLIPTETPLPTPTPSEAPTSTPIPTESPSPAPPTLAPTQAPSATPLPPPPPPPPTKKPKQKNVAAPSVRPPGVQLKDHWVDVDLSAQTVFAMQGDQIVKSFLVSTGRWPTTTVTGVFRIYVKYRAADMTGPDYYLPDVPYVMYFYKGYGLHGTYWHNNFGTPMSHGCVNLRTSDAGWLFEFSSVGSYVSVHQ